MQQIINRKGSSGEVSGSFAYPCSIGMVICIVATSAINSYLDGPAFYVPIKLGLGVLCLAIILILNNSRQIPKKTLPYLVPFSIMIFEYVIIIMSGGNPVHFLLLCICSAISLLYIDLKGLAIYFALINLLTFAVVYVFGIPVLGVGVSAYSVTSQFLMFNLFNFVLYFTCLFAATQSKKAARRSKAFDVIMENTPSFVAVIDKDERLKYISQSFADWLAIEDRAKSEGRPFITLIPYGGFRRKIQDIFADDQYYSNDLISFKVDGNDYWFIMRYSPRIANGGDRILGLYNLTPVMQAKRNADSALRAKDYFLANMSHAIRTPMNAIMGTSELLVTTNINEEQKNHIFSIRNASMSLLNIINDILDFSKTRSQNVQIENAPFPFSLLIGDTVNIISIKANAANLSFVLLLDKDIPQHPVGDILRIKQVLVNVLNNAIKYTNQGCITLRCGYEIKGDQVALSFHVKDTGIGIKKSDLNRLFSDFSQVDTLKNRYIEGTGLGLAISNNIVVAMGGSIAVESVYGEGSTFSFTINCGLTNNPETLASLENPGLYNLLCHESNQHYADAIKEMLGDLGVNYHICGDLREFELELSKNSYTHALFDKNAMATVENNAGKKTKLIFMKDISDRYAYKNFEIETINKPIIIRTLANVIAGNYSHINQLKSINDTSKKKLILTNVKILLVDDNPVNLMVGEGLLKQYGITVVKANGGYDAINKLANESFDMVFMDHMMPEIDGIETTKIIRQMSEDYLNLPIIAVTANATVGAREMFIEAGMDDFIPKPIEQIRLQKIFIKYIPSDKISYHIVRETLQGLPDEG